MKLSTCVSTLVATFLATAVPVVVNADGVCERNIALSDMGTVNINKVSDGELEIQVSITGDATQVTEDTLSEVVVDVCCPEGLDGGCTTHTQNVPEQPVVSFRVPAPQCLKEDGSEDPSGTFQVKVEAMVQKVGGLEALNELQNKRVQFSVSTDAGNDLGASYWDAEITGGLNNGLQLDGYCIDADKSLPPGTGKTGTITFSYGNVDLDVLEYCINTHETGSTVTSGTLQTAIWALVGDTPSLPGLGDYDETKAKMIEQDCRVNGQGYQPSCSDQVAFFLIPDNDKQPLVVYTGFGGLNIPCNSAIVTVETEVTCEPTTKTGPPGTFGDPHFLSWTGDYFDFMGAGCDVVLAQSTSFGDGLGLDAHARLRARYDYSYIEAAAVQIGDDIIEVGAWGTYIVNGIMDATLPVQIGNGNYVVTKAAVVSDHEFTLNIDRFQFGKTKETVLSLKAFKDLVSVRFMETTKRNFGDVRGIMGDFNQGKHLARDGHTVIEDFNEFGQEWRVLPGEDPELFATPNKDPYAKCTIGKSINLRDGRRLGENTISVEAATKACEHYGAPGAVQACIYDVIATGDLEAAKAGAV